MAVTSVITVVSALKVVSKWLDGEARAYHQGGSVTLQKKVVLGKARILRNVVESWMPRAFGAMAV